MSLKQQFKEHSKPVDATPVMQAALDCKTKEQKEAFLKKVKKSFDEAGKSMIQRAIYEKFMTPLEIATFQQDNKIDRTDMGIILFPMFAKLDGHTKMEDEIVLITSEGSELFNARAVIEKRFEKFKITIQSTIEAVEVMRKDDPEGVAEAEKRCAKQNAKH